MIMNENLEGLYLFGEANDKKIVTHKYNCSEDEYCVYIIEMAGELYVGSTFSAESRFKTHVFELRRGRHANTKMQKLYDQTHSLRMYIVFRTDGDVCKLMEQMLINLLRPSINTTNATSDNMMDVVWTTAKQRVLLSAEASTIKRLVERTKRSLDDIVRVVDEGKMRETDPDRHARRNKLINKE